MNVEVKERERGQKRPDASLVKMERRIELIQRKKGPRRYLGTQ